MAGAALAISSMRNRGVALPAVSNDEPTKIDKPLAAPPAATARVQLSTIPAGATVFVDGRAVGTSPLLLSGRPAETKTIHLSLNGHEERDVSVLFAEEDRRAEFRLTPLAVGEKPALKPPSKVRPAHRELKPKPKNQDEEAVDPWR